MEYLMTYGWAILIIAVVLGALFQLGVFNGATFAPKAPPGACQVFRPNGPGTTSFINTEGVCSGELPEYVATFTGTGNQYVVLPAFSSSIANGWTLSAWVNPASVSTQFVILVSQGSGFLQLGMALESGGTFECIVSSTGSSWESIAYYGSISTNKWQFITCMFSSTANNMTYYVDGTNVGHYSTTGTTYTGNSYPVIGAYYTGSGYYSIFDGSLANVQLYNTSFSSNEIQALYLEGIGGAPIDLQNLVGWWPLNGNANDYSGNENNGVPTNVVYTSSWTSGYTTP